MKFNFLEDFFSQDTHIYFYSKYLSITSKKYAHTSFNNVLSAKEHRDLLKMGNFDERFVLIVSHKALYKLVSVLTLFQRQVAFRLFRLLIG